MVSLPLSQKACNIFSASLQESGSSFKPGKRNQWHVAILSSQMWGLKSCCSLQEDESYSISHNSPQSILSHPLQEQCSQDQTTLLQQIGEGAAKTALIEGTQQGAVGHCGAPGPRMDRAGGETTAGSEAEESRKSQVWVLWFKLHTQVML